MMKELLRIFDLLTLNKLFYPFLVKHDQRRSIPAVVVVNHHLRDKLRDAGYCFFDLLRRDEAKAYASSSTCLKLLGW
ncbi:MAG: hypothetical protein ACOC7U_11020 [Spirochaetota bacterium]